MAWVPDGEEGEEEAGAELGLVVAAADVAGEDEDKGRLVWSSAAWTPFLAGSGSGSPFAYV